MTSTASGAKAMESDDPPPPFLTKTYDMVSDKAVNDVISWSEDGKSFVVWKPAEFARDLLPKHFKHNNFSSFVRQLNTYGFRKVDPDRWEFLNDNFQRHKRDSLREIRRRKATVKAEGKAKPDTSTSQALIEVGQFGIPEVMDQLKRDREVLMMELVRLRQRQSMLETQYLDMRHRVDAAEAKQDQAEKNQQHMFQFIRQAVKNPALLHQLIGAAPYGQSPPQIEDAETVKRKRKTARRGDSDMLDPTNSGALVARQPSAGRDNLNLDFPPGSLPSDELLNAIGPTGVKLEYFPSAFGDPSTMPVTGDLFPTASLQSDEVRNIMNFAEEGDPGTGAMEASFSGVPGAPSLRPSDAINISNVDGEGEGQTLDKTMEGFLNFSV